MPPSTHISSVVGILLIIMRLIWHGLNNHLPASDWHSHKKGWVGLGEQMVTFHMTKLINQHAGTQVQRRRAAPHHLFHHLQGTNTWAPIVAPWGSACSSVPLCQGWWHQNFPSALPQDAEKNEEKKQCIISAITDRPGKGCISDVKARDSHISAWDWGDKVKENACKSTYFVPNGVIFWIQYHFVDNTHPIDAFILLQHLQKPLLTFVFTETPPSWCCLSLFFYLSAGRITQQHLS